MASSAMYRYFPSRDDLLTRLIIDGYKELGEAAEDADDPASPPAERWLSVCRAARSWALAHPHEYALLYGSPGPGDSAPQDTVPADPVPAAIRVGVVLGRILGDAARAGALPPAAGVTTGSITPDVAGVLGGEHPALDDRVRTRGLLAWSGVFGAISFELFGHFVGSVTDPDAFFDDAMRDLAGLLGL